MPGRTLFRMCGKNIGVEGLEPDPSAEINVECHERDKEIYTIVIPPSLHDLKEQLDRIERKLDFFTGHHVIIASKFVDIRKLT